MRLAWVALLAFAMACAEGDDGGASVAATGADPGNLPAPAPPASSGDAAFTGKAFRLAPAVIVDPAGFGGPIAAATLFVPDGWQTEGGVVWGNQHACTNGYAIEWRAFSPDTLSGIALLPQQGWDWNNYDSGPARIACPLATIPDVRTYLSLVVQEVRPDATITGFRARPDLAADYAHLAKEGPTPVGRERTWFEGGEVTMAFEQNGTAIHGTVAAVVRFDYMLTNGALGPIENLSAHADPGFAAWAPADRYDPMLFEAIRRSVHADDRWLQLIAQHNATMGDINLRGAMERHRITTEANREIAAIRNEAWRASQKSSDERAQQFVDYLRDEERYHDPDAPGGEQALSSFYDHAYKLEDGTYVLTDEEGFEPYRVFGIDGEKLNRVR